MVFKNARAQETWPSCVCNLEDGFAAKYKSEVESQTIFGVYVDNVCHKTGKLRI
jgi:hypothetical protein